jgi:hypothetical protein
MTRWVTLVLILGTTLMVAEQYLSRKCATQSWIKAHSPSLCTMIGPTPMSEYNNMEVRRHLRHS